jgi:C4-dicarboxylate-specific signal transduction histidine kinase
MKSVLKKAVSLAALRVPAEGVRMTTSVKEGARRLRADARALAECFAHLLVNAVEATRDVPKPAVQMTAECCSREGRDCVRVRVQDNGPGISEDVREELFSPFCSTKARGLGLGLPIARRTVTDHQGELTVDSGEEGTVVTVVLPPGLPVDQEVEHEAVTGRR